MGFVKVVKNKSYFKRFQVKYRRRRECKTDYTARKSLITQDKNKYKSPKYRLVVRRTNRDIICQIFTADLTHDVCVAAAYAHELQRYGVKAGFTNYAAAYATGLLLARRVAKKFNLEGKYDGKTEIDGAYWDITEELDDKDRSESRFPFKAALDVGLARTTTGARIFGALKGAVDGGLQVPHNPLRFPGSKRVKQEIKEDPETHRKYIFAGHVADYMNIAQKKNKDFFERQFRRYLANKITADKIAGMWTAAHKAIRADPTKKRDALERGYFAKARAKAKPAAADIKASLLKAFALPNKDKNKIKRPNRVKINASQRFHRLKQKFTAIGFAQPIIEYVK